MADAITDQTKVIFVANPNNPTGTMVTQNQVEQLVEQVPNHVLIVFDEAYCEYIDRSDYPQTINYISEKGNIIIGIVAFSAIAWVTGLGNFNGVMSSPPPMTHLMTFDLGAALSASMVTVIFTLFFIDFFDTAGTLTSVANVAGKIGSDGKIKDIDKAMLSDSVSTVAGAMLGTSTVTTYVESAAGVKAGGRTGMTSLVIGVLFLACLFFSPLATSLPKEVDAAALIYIATLFVRNITDIEWEDAAEAGPAVLAMIAMPFTYSISNGIALAFVSYAAIRICTGKIDSTSPAIWVIAILSVISFAVA